MAFHFLNVEQYLLQPCLSADWCWAVYTVFVRQFLTEIIGNEGDESQGCRFEIQDKELKDAKKLRLAEGNDRVQKSQADRRLPSEPKCCLGPQKALLLSWVGGEMRQGEAAGCQRGG